MAIDYNDSRFTDLTNEKNNAINESNTTYDNLINESNKYYEDLINQNKDAADKQKELQNEQTKLTIDKIEQEKQKSERDYEKEQKGAYQDYMRQSNVYGSNLQAMGQKGLSGSGWSETIQSGYYNTYQNRYAQARESFNDIVLNYNNNIKEAQLQNSSALAKIYADAQEKQLELALQNFSVIKDLKLSKQNAATALDSEYNNRWRQVESQINSENSLAEQIRQYNESLALQKQQLAQSQAQWEKEFALSQKKLAEEKRQFNLNYSKSSSSGGINKNSSSSSSDTSSSSNSNKFTATKTPMLSKVSDKNVMKWYNSKFKESMSESDLNTAIVEGLNKKYFTSNDVAKIYKSYGFDNQTANSIANELKNKFGF